MASTIIIFVVSLCIAGYEQYSYIPNRFHSHDFNQQHNHYPGYNPPQFQQHNYDNQPSYYPDYNGPQFHSHNYDNPPSHFPDYTDYPSFGYGEKKPIQVNPIFKPSTPKYPILSQEKISSENPGLDSIGMPKDGKNHPCYRTCQKGDRKVCFYRFHVEWYNTMSKACMNCTTNPADCDRPDCIPANGIGRAITVVNRKMPGPSVEVCKDDTIVVDVENSLMASGTTIHWHGLLQKETPYMDGTPFVTQCPISPESTFRYAFPASEAGTFFWHSHIGLERGDGMTGALIVREPKQNSENSRLYGSDISEHVIVVTDWINNVSISLFTDHHHADGDNRPQALLINGRGRFTVVSNVTSSVMKAPVFEVEQGQKYRFRMINAQYLNCPLEVSVDGHNLTIIASDGNDIVPIENVAALVSYTGERYDFIINADKPVDTYWIRFRALLACNLDNPIRHVAVLKYKGAKTEEPSAALNWNINRPGLVVNWPQQGEEQAVTLPVVKMRTLAKNDATSKKVADHQIYIAFDMNLKNNTHYHRVPYYGTEKVVNTSWLYTPQLNHISMKMPKSPLLVTRPSDSSFCNNSTVNSNCITEYCECPHVLSVKRNAVVEVILVDEGKFGVNHPFHLHGHTFRVVGQKRVGETTADRIRAEDKAGKITRNLDHAPVKDTVFVPAGGYTIIRFIADNPGYWFFHCHIEFHADIGMSLVFKVGEHNEMKPVPKDFPRCGDYIGYEIPKPR